MFRLLVIACLGIAIQGFSLPTFRQIRDWKTKFPHGKIIGGEPISIDKVPWQVAIEGNAISNAFCAGSIISPNYILTAAHCTDGATPAYLQVRSGTSRAERGGYLTGVLSYAQHPNYTYTTVDYDVALLRLTEPLEFDETQQAVSLRKKEAVAGELALISGWGQLDDGNFPNDLQATQVPVVDREECNKAYLGDITARMICAGIKGKDSCSGDSGGAITVQNAQIGIVSWGYGCGQEGYPGVYSNVAVLADYINENSNNEADWV